MNTIRDYIDTLAEADDIVANHTSDTEVAVARLSQALQMAKQLEQSLVPFRLEYGINSAASRLVSLLTTAVHRRRSELLRLGN